MGLTLAIEISNPSSGPRGEVRAGPESTVLAGPGVALARDGGEPDTELLNQTGRHDDDLMPAIDRLFRRAGARPADLSRIALSIGPGGYTSLRIAVATAKLLAEATGAQVLPIPSAHVAAFFIPDAAPMLVCLASKGTTAHATLLPAGPHRFAHAQVLGLIDAAALAPSGCRTIVGDRFLPEPFRDAAQRAKIPILEPVFAAASLLHLARAASPADPLALAPLYAREAEAVTQWRLRHPTAGA
jgi:tRNA threonylcarbamoyladenosine biosynthesis protein TsaB